MLNLAKISVWHIVFLHTDDGDVGMNGCQVGDPVRDPACDPVVFILGDVGLILLDDLGDDCGAMWGDRTGDVGGVGANGDLVGDPVGV